MFAPPVIRGRPNPDHLEREEYLAIGRRLATVTARRNGAVDVDVTFPGNALAPLRVRVVVHDRIELGPGASVSGDGTAEAELVPPGAFGAAGAPGVGEYAGPLAYRQGKPMRPDVALAFDRMAAAAARGRCQPDRRQRLPLRRRAGALFAAHPDPKWVAPPGQSLHRLGTELDLGPPSAHTAGWRATPRDSASSSATRWEPWHYGLRSTPARRRSGSRAAGADGDAARTMPSFVPARFAPRSPAPRGGGTSSGDAARRAALRGVELQPVRALAGRARRASRSSCPATARAYGLDEPVRRRAAIDAQAHLMRDLLRQFGAVPLALAAYNAGPAPVSRCGCVPPFPETQAYVADILGLLDGAGDALGRGGGGLEIRLVR